MNRHDLRRRLLSTAFLTVVGSTFVLTAGFVGFVALLSGDSSGSSGRFPYYVLVMAVAFLVSLWQLDDRRRDGSAVLIAATGIAIGAAVLLSLAAEGVLYAVAEPSRVVDSHLVVYFLSAAIICTALGIWGFRHWREFTNSPVVEPVDGHEP